MSSASDSAVASAAKCGDVVVNSFTTPDRVLMSRHSTDTDSCDIDVIVETNHSINDSPICVLLELEDAIRERECYKNVRVQTHSIGIDMANFHLDVVPLVNDEDGLLYIGSKDDSEWRQTNPK